MIDADYDCESIYNAAKRCLFDDDFRKTCRECENPYGTGDAGIKVAHVLAEVPIDLKLLQKVMTY